MSHLPSLEELLDEPFALILGAGASMDYRFPSWEALKHQLMVRLKDPLDPVASIFGPKTAQDFLFKIQTMKSNQTIDSITEGLDDNRFKLFQLLTASILLNCEENSKSIQYGWIEVFVQKIADLFECKMKSNAKPLNVFSNLHIISLNYDRLFAYRFLYKIDNAIREKMERPRQFEQKGYDLLQEKIGPIIHPHGAIGTFNEGLYRINCSTYLNKQYVSK